jgi:hypothetical protein
VSSATDRGMPAQQQLWAAAVWVLSVKGMHQGSSTTGNQPAVPAATAGL